jgi:hypothetical protein
VVISFSEKLHAAGSGQLLECGYYLWRIQLELLQQYTGDAIGYLKSSPVFFNQLEHEQIRGEVALICYFSANLGVLMVVKVVSAVVKNGIMP